MHEVTAYEDDRGRLHRTRRSAIEAEFADMVKIAWGSFPADDGKGDPAVIARLLFSDIYRMGRARLIEALRYLEENGA